jgi:hypothetical protein
MAGKIGCSITLSRPPSRPTIAARACRNNGVVPVKKHARRPDAWRKNGDGTGGHSHLPSVHLVAVVVRYRRPTLPACLWRNCERLDTLHALRRIVQIRDCFARRMCTRANSGRAGCRVKWPSNKPTLSICVCVLAVWSRASVEEETSEICIPA